MGLLDKKGRLFGLINILDLAIVLIIVALLAGGLYIYKSHRAETQLPTTPIEIDIELVLDKDTVDAIEVGQPVIDNQKGANLGVIYDKKVTEQKGVFGDATKGEFVENVIPGQYNVIISLKTDAVVEPDRITVYGLEINIGRPVYFKCGSSYIGSGYFIGIRLP
ncbi:MAG TPA: DUF4330 domain-containing protein [Clostridiaceae bacterium]|nr:DUF4330 domain-containing protein [Clostridiaceae bacterium]